MKKQPDEPSSKTPDKMNELIALLRNTKESELDCEEFWEKGAGLADATASLSDEDLKLYLHHLEICPGCHENFEILKSIIKDSSQET